MASEEHPNAKLVREGFQAFERGDMEWMGQHLADDIVWHVGGNSKWAGSYEGKEQVLQFFARQAQALGGGPPSLEIHDVLGGDEHVVVLGEARASSPDGQSAEWKYVQVFHVRDGKATEAWGMAENDAAVDPFLDSLQG
jgi:ketosteroid isomerase-like protein